MKLLISFLILLCASAQAEILRGLASAITDGDTIVVSDGTQSHKVRLNGIDAPELSQPFGKESRAALARIIEYQSVVVIWSKRDKYDRIIGTVTWRSADVGLTLLYQGWAWYFKKYESDVAEIERVIYQEAEASARQRRVGLWQANNPQAPWDARHPEPIAESAVIAPVAKATQSTSAPTPVLPSRQVTPRPVEPSYQAPVQRSEIYFRGPRGGCYYLRGSRKVYVDRSLCN